MQFLFYSLLWKGILDGWHCKKLCLDISPSRSPHRLLVLTMEAVGAVLSHLIFGYVSQTGPLRFFFSLIDSCQMKHLPWQELSAYVCKVLLPLFILFYFLLNLFILTAGYLSSEGDLFLFVVILVSGIWIPWISGVILLLSLVLLHLLVFWDVRL